MNIEHEIRKSYPLQRVYIKWIDASFTTEQQAVSEMDDNYVLDCCGFLVKEDSNFITIAMEYLEKDNLWRYIHHIPKPNIISRDDLSVKKRCFADSHYGRELGLECIDKGK